LACGRLLLSEADRREQERHDRQGEGDLTPETLHVFTTKYIKP
jgi:hypothetical protein